MLNARVDCFITGAGGVDEAVARANAYLAAGADCVYPILAPAESIGALAAAIAGPVNVLADPADPQIARLEGLGIARVTFGSRLASIALAEAARLAALALG